MKPILLSIASLAVLGLFCNPLLAQSNSTAVTGRDEACLQQFD